jgi:5'-nucleotidase
VASKTLDIFHFNDFHRRLQPCADGSGGAARLATRIKAARAEHPDSLLVNVGDVAGDGTAPGPLAFEPIPRLFNAMGVDVLALGNHEFEDPAGGYASLREGLIRPFQGEVLCANVTQADSGRPLPGTRPYTIRQLAGLNVALIGVVTQDLTSALFPAAGAGLQVAGLRPTLEKLVPEVRARGADVVVVLAHESLNEVRQVARQVDGVDLYLAAHDHRETASPVLETTPSGRRAAVAEAGGYGQNLGHVRLTVDADSRTVVGVEGRLLPVGADLPEDPEVRALVEQAPALERLSGAEAPRRRWETVGKTFAELREALARRREGAAQGDPALPSPSPSLSLSAPLVYKGKRLGATLTARSAGS